MSEQDKNAAQIHQVVQTFYDTCKTGKGFDRLKPLFHDQVVFMPPGLSAHVQGRDICLKTYEDACSSMTFHKLEASEEHIDIYGQTAMMAYKYDCIFEFQGKKHEDDGHEILMLLQEDGDWKLAWRTLIPGSRKSETCPVEEAKAAEQAGASQHQHIKATCLDLMSQSLTCQLTTIDEDGFPHTTAMNNLRCTREYPSLVDVHKNDSNDFLLYMSTSNQSNKMARMLANPKVSAYFCDSDNIVGLMLGGEIEVITDQDLKNRIWQKGWTMYYPNGPEGPEYGVIRLTPRVAKGWHKNGPFEIRLGTGSQG